MGQPKYIDWLQSELSLDREINRDRIIQCVTKLENNDKFKLQRNRGIPHHLAATQLGILDAVPDPGSRRDQPARSAARPGFQTRPARPGSQTSRPDSKHFSRPGSNNSIRSNNSAYSRPGSKSCDQKLFWTETSL